MIKSDTAKGNDVKEVQITDRHAVHPTLESQKLFADLDLRVSDEGGILREEGIPDFWDDHSTSERLADYLTSIGWRKSAETQAVSEQHQLHPVVIDQKTGLARDVTQADIHEMEAIATAYQTMISAARKAVANDEQFCDSLWDVHSTSTNETKIGPTHLVNCATCGSLHLPGIRCQVPPAQAPMYKIANPKKEGL